MKRIIITGANGQLGKCLKDIFSLQLNIETLFLSQEDLDIRNKQALNKYLTQEADYCINCAAYTNVDKAEEQLSLSQEINAESVKYIAEVCKKNEIKLIHISTDFVFDGQKSTPYTEEDVVNPLGSYGKTKLQGEQYIQQLLEEYYILRTSWLYSEYENNFLKTMLRLGKERESLGVVFDQVGTPTYAKDLAEIILRIMSKKEELEYGVYHYSNEGVASWYDFAKAIFDEMKYPISLKPILTEEYPTPAQRPSYSVLNKSKIKANLDVEIPYWRDSLINCIKKL